MFDLKNSYLNLPETFYRKTTPARFPAPALIAFNHLLASELGLHTQSMDDDALATFFSGQSVLESPPTISLAYAGFQFGHPNPQLGDGRAHLLGESAGFDIQLKGSGPTPFSRGGDGKSALGPVLREYIVSEAMHRMGVPTTRALSAVRTGETVIRQDGPEPGGVFARVAASHIRVGTFQYFSFQQDNESVATLLDYTVERHYEELKDLPRDQKAMELLKALTHRQAELVAHWSALGFIHGVMNTDNVSLAGITIDYGPCAFMEAFSFQKVLSSVDRQGRYAFINQVPIAKWNILRLAESLLPLIHEDQARGVLKIEKELIPLFDVFEEKRSEKWAGKLGIAGDHKADESLVLKFLKYLESENMDFTLSFYNLPDLYKGEDSFYKPSTELNAFVEKWRPRVLDIDRLRAINPLYIPRNHLVQRAIDHAYRGDDSYFHSLNKVLSEPYVEQTDASEFATPATPGERVYQTFCGT